MGKRRRDHHSSEELGEGTSLSRQLETHEPGDLAKRFGSSAREETGDAKDSQ